MKIAVCSTKGLKVDLHFGKTKTFFIFNLENGVITMIDMRKVEEYSPSSEFLDENEENHEFDQEKFDQIYNAIKDCDAVYTTKIGQIPMKKLYNRGLKVKLCSCSIESIAHCNGDCI